MQDDSPRPGRSDYLDFDLEIGIGTGRNYPVAVLDSPAGEARGSMHFPFDTLVLENRLLTLQNALLRSGGPRRRTLSPEEQAVQDFGRELFEALFIPEVRSCFDVSLREADQQRKGLRLKLRIQSPEMAVLPWEYLYHPGQAEYVSLSTRTPIVRYLEMPQRIQPLAVTPPLRILGMIASPSDLPFLDVEREKERIERAIGDLRARGLVDLTWLLGQTWRDLLRAMRQGEWHIFHFVGHGGFDRQTGEGLIALADREGQAARFHAKQLGRLLANHACLRLVLLNSCEGAKGSERDVFSSTAATLVRRGIPAVLAMQDEITDDAAIEFARQFYEALADGMPVDGAMAEARMALSFAVTNTVEWGTPVLYMRTPDGVLFRLTEATRTDAPTPALPADEELEQRLRHHYTAGLSAFWLEEWDRACGHFQVIVEVRPDYRDAADKLAEARRQQEWNELYEQAQAARKDGNRDAALSALEELVAEKPDYKDAIALLEMAKRQKRLADLYAQARHLHRAGQWQAVVNVFAQIAALDPAYPDLDELLPTAERGIEEQKKQEKLNNLYEHALQEMAAGRWEDAYQSLLQVQEMDAGYRDAAPLLSKIQAEIEREEAERRRTEQIASLYKEAQELFHAQEWQQALVRMDEIYTLEPHFDDSQGVAARAQEEVERQGKLDVLYSQAQAALKARDWQEAQPALEALLAEQSDYKDAAALLERVKKQKGVADLYAQARHLHRAGQWQAVVNVFAQIAALEPEFADPEELLPSAEQEIAAQKRRAELEDLYRLASQALEAQQWEEALRLLRRVQEREPGYREIEQLLATADAEIEEQRQQEAKRQDWFETLYEEAEHQHWFETLYEKALRLLRRVQEREPGYIEIEQLLATADAEIEEQRQQEAERQDWSETLFEEADPKRVGGGWSVLLMAIGLSIGSVVGGVLGWSVGWESNSAILGVIGAIGAAISGVSIGLVFRWTQVFTQWTQVTIVVVGWVLGDVIAWAIDWAVGTAASSVALVATSGLIGSVIAWAVSGVSIGLALRRSQAFIQWKQVLIVAISWLFGWFIGSVVWVVIVAAVDPAVITLGWVVVNGAITGTIAGAIGGWVTLWQFRKAPLSSP
jgi:outer membrane protein assembly factor BamD (BamD/ComL family)